MDKKLKHDFRRYQRKIKILSFFSKVWNVLSSNFLDLYDTLARPFEMRFLRIREEIIRRFDEEVMSTFCSDGVGLRKITPNFYLLECKFCNFSILISSEEPEIERAKIKENVKIFNSRWEGVLTMEYNDRESLVVRWIVN